MKSLIVGFLAVAALSGCGVGVDDPEGQQAGQAPVAQTQTAALLGNTAAPQPDFIKTGGVDPHNALPQDPIPLFEGKVVPGQPPPDPFSPDRPFR
jgi:hypothetical protein